MKNFLPILIAAFFVWLPSVKSQVTFIGENTTACESSTITVDVTVDNFASIVSAQFGVTWDPAIVEFSAVTDNMPPTALYNTSNAINGELRFSWFDFSVPPGTTLPNGTIMFTITFNVLGNYGDISPVAFGSLPGFPLEVADTGGIIPNANIVLLPGSVSIEDNINPVISGCPANISVNVPHGQSAASVSWVAPTATDNCGTPALTSTHNPGDVFPVGTTTVTYTAADGNGNTDNCIFDVSVIENPLPPTALAFIAGDTSVNCPSTQVDIPMSVANFNQITSFQFGLMWDPSILQYDSVTNNLPPVALYNDLNAAAGELRVSWFDLNPPIGMTLTPPDTVIFILHFTLLNTNFVSTDIGFTSFPLFPIEVADTSGILNNADIVFESSTVTIVDTTPPVISGCPANMTAGNAPGICGAVVAWTPPTATDNCSTVTLTSTHNSGDTFPVGTTTVTYTATDVIGNATTCSFDVTVNDIENPAINNCPANISVNNDPDSCNAVVNWTVPTATDNCLGVVLTSTHNSGDIFDVGTTTVTYTATDASGNSVTCSFDVTVNDTQDPAINNCPANITVDNDPDSCNAVVNWTVPTATDNCPGVVLTSTHNTGEIFPVGTTTVTYTATDASGNSVTCSFDVIVNDAEPPITLCQDITIPLDNTGNTSITAAQIDNGSSDNCGISSMAVAPNTFTCTEVGPNTVTLTVTDVNGNSGTCTATVTVEDKLPPIALCQDITIQLDASGNATIMGTQINNGSTDACGIVTLEANPSAFDCSNVGDNVVTLTVTDVNGNVSTCTATVTVEDVTPPVAICQDITVQLDSSGSVTITGAQIDNGSTDTCGIGSLDANPNTFDCSNIGANTVTLTVTDVNGNTSTCTATVTVEDNIAPSITCPANITVSNDLDSCNAVVNWADPIVSDNCPGATFTSTIASGSIFAVGPATTVTYTATDASGNTSTCSFTVTVNDDQAPVITCPSGITVDNDVDSCGAVVAWSLPTFSDNCGVTSVDSTHASGDIFPVGTTTVTYTAHDAAGNTTSCSFDVTVNDAQAPVIAGCPGNMTVSNDMDSCNAVVTWAAPTATDNCPDVT
ncbi:MAG: HYR domain-containing protein, partial [Saprospiraceae bacterium]